MSSKRLPTKVSCSGSVIPSALRLGIRTMENSTRSKRSTKYPSAATNTANTVARGNLDPGSILGGISDAPSAVAGVRGGLAGIIPSLIVRRALPVSNSENSDSFRVTSPRAVVRKGTAGSLTSNGSLTTNFEHHYETPHCDCPGSHIHPREHGLGAALR